MIHDMQVPDDHRNMQARVKLISLPFKRLGLHTAAASTIIARSDSNGEDLEAFAGAGTSPFHALHLQHRHLQHGQPAYLPMCVMCSDNRLSHVAVTHAGCTSSPWVFISPCLSLPV